MANDSLQKKRFQTLDRRMEFLLWVDVPMVTASRLKRNIPNDHLVKRNHIKIAIAVKILCVVDVFSANGKQAGTANRF